ncbi:MAG: glycosyltransferase [Symploca sp. SIO1B1]|nr:glycosyltransferase [Symploca sp. SIO1B1]
MNVLLINQSDIAGGAALAGYRLHQGLLAQGIDSHLLAGTVKTNSDRVKVFPRRGKIEKQLQVLGVASGFGLNELNYIGTFSVPQHNFYKSADILNFHNLHTGYFNYLGISSLTKNKPAVFTLHDMWAFTGHCSYSYDCDRWKTGCGKCPYPNTYPPVSKDNTNLEWKLKNWTYSRSNLNIVAPSKWLYEQAQQSMLSRFPIHHIPNGIDTEAYQPIDRELCRSMLDIPPGKKVLMFGAESLKDARKGGDLLLKALSSLPTSLKAETVLLTIGNGGETIPKAAEMQTVNLGFVGGDRLKSVAYSAADLLVFPTRADNLPLVLQESLACGTPMVSFKVGGVPDLVRPGITGYLATAEYAEDMSKGIVELLEDDNLREQMSKNCRAIALQEYALEIYAQRYITLYKQVLGVRY